jgi:DNA polymerase elongation subunit (family B)
VLAEIHFEDYNIGVAELITGFARYALLGLKRAIEALGYPVIYGDTDSLFVKDTHTKETGNLNQIIELAKSQYGVEIEKDKVFKIFIIPSTAKGETNPSQKQYFGLLDDGEVYSTTLIGMKSNFPKYYQEIMWKLIDANIIEEFYSNEDFKNSQNKDKNSRVANVTREIFNAFDEAVTRRDMKFIIRKLAYTLDNDRPLSTYSNNGWQKQVFQEILEDCNSDRALAEKKVQAHTIIPYWRIAAIGRGKDRKTWTTHPERYIIDKGDYKRLLWGRVKPILDSYLFTKEECKRLKAELVDRQ